MWIWVVAGIILGILLISNRVHMRNMNGESNDHHFEEENDEDDLFEEYMIIDLIEEEEDTE
jgi:hypothetical protein